jgi:hypothetical protein
MVVIRPRNTSRAFQMAGLICGMIIGTWLHAKGYL